MRDAIAADTPPAPAAAPQLLPGQPPAAGPTEVHDRRTEPPPGEGDELEDLVDGAAGKTLDELAQALEELTEEDIADVLQLAFGLVSDTPGNEHWEIDDRRARRLGKWAKKVLERHDIVWLKAWLPEIVFGVLLSYEVLSRVRIGKKRAAERKAKEAADAPAHG